MWILGVDTLDEALRRLEPFKLDGVVQKMRCPFLLVHGEDDEQIPLKDAQALYDACGSPDKTFRVFTGEEGGAQHCQRDYLTLGCAEGGLLTKLKFVKRPGIAQFGSFG